MDPGTDRELLVLACLVGAGLVGSVAAVVALLRKGRLPTLLGGGGPVAAAPRRRP
jgi:hypothetical protein